MSAPATTPAGVGHIRLGHHLRPTRTVLAFVLLGAAAIFARHHGISLWALAVGVVGPDLSFLAAAGAPNPGDGRLARRAVRPYNAVHHPAGPIALTAIGLAAAVPVATVIGLAWLSHLAWDRGLGYRLRAKDGSIPD
jgi:hypothetical protein